MNRFKYMAASVVMMILSSCSTLKMKSWSDPSVGERPIGKVMVLAVVDSPTTCRLFEGYFVEKLTERGIDASSCHVVLQPDGEISEELLEEQLKADGYDSIIITRLMSEDSHSQVVQAGYSSSPAFPSYYGSYHGFYSASVISPVTYVDSVMEYLLETTLYDVKSGKMIWGGMKSVYDTSSESSNIKKVVKAVVSELNKKKLL